MNKNDDPEGVPLKVTVLDTVTGEERTRETPFNTFWWSEGNGSCDCNRRLMFFPEHAEAGDERTCLGCVRYRVTEVEPQIPGYQICDFNWGYPDRLFAEHPVEAVGLSDIPESFDDGGIFSKRRVWLKGRPTRACKEVVRRGDELNIYGREVATALALFRLEWPGIAFTLSRPPDEGEYD